MDKLANEFAQTTILIIMIPVSQENSQNCKNGILLTTVVSLLKREVKIDIIRGWSD